MNIYTVNQTHENLFELINEIAEKHETICITGRRNNAILISEDDFRVIQETLHAKSEKR